MSAYSIVKISLCFSRSVWFSLISSAFFLVLSRFLQNSPVFFSILLSPDFFSLPLIYIVIQMYEIYACVAYIDNLGKVGAGEGIYM